MPDNLTDLLRQSEVFARLDEADLRKIARSIKERRVDRDEVLFRQGDASDALYIVQSGRIRISAADPTGRQKVLAFAGAGEVVGEMGLLSGESRSATAVASTEARLLQLRKTDFDALLTSNVGLMRDLARVVSRRRATTQQRAMDETGSGGGYKDGLVTAIFSPRGGAGTTTVATNLAVALAQRFPDRVALLDLHTLFGHVPLLLNLTPRTGLASISAVSLRQMDREMLEFYLTTHAESSLRVLCSALRPEDSELVTGDHARAVLDLLRRQFVHVVVDMGRAFSEVNLNAIEVAHNIMIVCTPDQECKRGVGQTQRSLRDVLHLPADPLQYVLNRPSPYAPVSPEQLEQTLGVRFVATIPYGGDAPARAALEGHPVVTRFPGSAMSKSIVGLAARLEQQLAEVRALAPATFLTVS
jgi:CRP-like cAMP-binding protein